MKKAPDKIYLREFGDSLSQVWSGIKPTEETIIASHEYIRKDALMEWAKETYLSENASAIRKVCFKQLVEKLMSM